MTYNALLDAGWTMDAIDYMDIHGYIKVRAWEATRKAAKENPAPEKVFIDQVWPNLN